MRRARFILPFKLCAKSFEYTETDDVIGTVNPFTHSCSFGSGELKRNNTQVSTYGTLTDIQVSAMR